jgi:L-amino acid N-acyltransferase YncA/DNA-binding transcriptional ArsR family regulator
MDTERTAASEPGPGPLDRRAAGQYAAWFRALGDPTRVRVVSVLARAGQPLAVGEIVAALGISQSTVSQHLRILAGVGFVRAGRRGTARLYRINEACVAAFPTAAAVVAGRTPPGPVRVAPAAAAPGRAGQPAAEPAPAQPGPGSGGAAGITVRPMWPADAPGVLAIYQAGLDSGDASFETAAPSWDRFDETRLAAHRFVAVAPAGRVAGWVAVSQVSDRCVYAGVVEHSVYVDPAARGQGVGAALLRELIRSTEAAGIWTIQSGIFPENAASLRLHERAGFRVVGIRRQVGRHHGRWRDVVLVERRSPVTGTG